MAVGTRPKLGNTLQSLVAGDQQWPMPQQMPAPAPGMEVKPRSKGQMIAGIIGDALASVTGGQPVYTQMLMGEKQDAREDAQWSRRREAENQDWTQRETWKLANQKREPTAMERNLATFQGWGPDQRKAYGEMQQAERGDPFVTTTLPNGQFYAGPQSQLTAVLMGQGSTPAKPRRLGPVVDTKPGGPTQPASGTFRP